METGFAYNTGSGLSTLDDQHLTRLTVDELIVESDAQLPGGITLPTDLIPLQTMRDNINALPNGEVMIKSNTDQFTSIAKSSSYSATDSNLVERESGKIKTNTLSVGTSDGGTSELNIKTSTGASASMIGSDNLTVNLIRNGGGSDNFGGDGSSDWRFQNSGGNLFIERGNAGLTNGYASILSLPFDNTIQINRRRTGQEIETVPLRMYRQVSGGTANADYIDLKPDSISGTHTQLLPDLDGTFVLDSTTEYVALNSLRTDFNTQTTNNLLFRDGTDSFGNIAYDNAFDTGSLIAQKDSGTLKAVDFLAKQAGNGYMFQSYINPAVISYLYHGTNSGLGVAVEMPTTSGVMISDQTSEYAGLVNLRNTMNNLLDGQVPVKDSLDDFAPGLTPLDGYLDNATLFPNTLVKRDGNGDVHTKRLFMRAGASSQYDIQIIPSVSQTADTAITIPTTGGEMALVNDGIWTVTGSDIENTNSGNVGVGKSPDSGIKLDVDGTAQFTGTVTLTNAGPTLILRDTTDRDDVNIQFEGLSGTNQVNAKIGTSNDYLTLETVTSTNFNGIQLKGNNNLAMTVTNTGGVSIGGSTVQASHSLDVFGNAIFRGTNTYQSQNIFQVRADFLAGLSLAQGSFTLNVDPATLTANRTITMPDDDGTVALTSDGIWTVDGNDIYNSNSDNVGIGVTSSINNKLVIQPVNSNDAVKILGHYQNNTTFLGAGGNVPQSGPVYRDSILACGNGSLGGTPGTTYDIVNGFRQAYIESLGAYYFQAHNGSTTPTTLLKLYKSTSEVEVTTGDFDVAAGNVSVQAGTTTSGINLQVGVTKIGNGLSNYAMFSHSSNHTLGNYALLQQNDGETFLNAASNKQIHFRINNGTVGGFDDAAGAERTFFNFPGGSFTKPEFNSSGEPVAKYVSIDNPTFRVYAASGAQNSRQVMYSQVVVDSSTTPFTQAAFPLQDYGVQPGFTSPNPGFAFRIGNPNTKAQIHCSFAGYTTVGTALQTVKLQMYAKKSDGTNAYVDICTFDFFVNLANNHESFSFSKLVSFTHEYYSHARFVLVSGSFTGSTGDYFHLTIDQLPRQTR